MVFMLQINLGNDSSNEMDHYLFHFHFDSNGRIRLHPDVFGVLGGKYHESSIAQKQGN